MGREVEIEPDGSKLGWRHADNQQALCRPEIDRLTRALPAGPETRVIQTPQWWLDRIRDAAP
ncbi:hypothetical protein BJF78_07380 [Pseudonocardia sp. CNS-139]|nr:hypothetical protein BJF78_07380 [Pseudonocardia sp. CNS-139]